MKYKLQLTKKAKNDFVALEKNAQERIADKLRFFIAQKNPLVYAKKLRSSQLGTYRYRIGDYRAIFDIDGGGKIIILLILRVKHRKEVYRNF